MKSYINIWNNIITNSSENRNQDELYLFSEIENNFIIVIEEFCSAIDDINEDINIKINIILYLKRIINENTWINLFNKYGYDINLKNICLKNLMTDNYRYIKKLSLLLSHIWLINNKLNIKDDLINILYDIEFSLNDSICLNSAIILFGEICDKILDLDINFVNENYSKIINNIFFKFIELNIIDNNLISNLIVSLKYCLTNLNVFYTNNLDYLYKFYDFIYNQILVNNNVDLFKNIVEIFAESVKYYYNFFDKIIEKFDIEFKKFIENNNTQEYMYLNFIILEFYSEYLTYEYYNINNPYFLQKKENGIIMMNLILNKIINIIVNFDTNLIEYIYEDNIINNYINYYWNFIYFYNDFFFEDFENYLVKYENNYIIYLIINHCYINSKNFKILNIIKNNYNNLISISINNNNKCYDHLFLQFLEELINLNIINYSNENLKNIFYLWSKFNNLSNIENFEKVVEIINIFWRKCDIEEENIDVNEFLYNYINIVLNNNFYEENILNILYLIFVLWNTKTDNFLNDIDLLFIILKKFYNNITIFIFIIDMFESLFEKYFYNNVEIPENIKQFVFNFIVYAKNDVDSNIFNNFIYLFLLFENNINNCLTSDLNLSIQNFILMNLNNNLFFGEYDLILNSAKLFLNNPFNQSVNIFNQVFNSLIEVIQNEDNIYYKNKLKIVNVFVSLVTEFDYYLNINLINNILIWLNNFFFNLEENLKNSENKKYIFKQFVLYLEIILCLSFPKNTNIDICNLINKFLNILFNIIEKLFFNNIWDNKRYNNYIIELILLNKEQNIYNFNNDFKNKFRIYFNNWSKKNEWYNINNIEFFN